MSKNKTKSWIAIFFENLVSVRFAVILLFILIPIVIAGSLVPQGRPFAEYAQAYGIKTAEIFHRVYLTSVFQSPAFLILIVLLGINVLGCFIKSLAEKKRTWGFILVHVSLILLIVGGMVSAVWRTRGELILEEGQSATSFKINEKEIPLGFEIRLKDFELQNYETQGPKLAVLLPDRKEPQTFAFRQGIWTAIPGTSFQFRVEKALLDFRFDMNTKTAFSASDEPNNPAVQVHVKGKDADYTEWVFANFGDFHGKNQNALIFRYLWSAEIPKAFISHVEILENGKVVMEKAIKVNQPLTYKGFSIYQASYDSQEQKWSGLEIVKDPGTGIIYTSIVLMMLGLALNIYINPLLKKKKLSSK